MNLTAMDQTALCPLQGATAGQTMPYRFPLVDRCIQRLETRRCFDTAEGELHVRWSAGYFRSPVASVPITGPV